MPKIGCKYGVRARPDMREIFPSHASGDSRHLVWRCIFALFFAATACSPIDAPDPRTANVPVPIAADARRKAVNEGNDSILIVELPKDALVPKSSMDDPLPDTPVGPFNFRGETLSNALELVLSDLNIPIAFESNEGLKRRITISNLTGSVDKVVEQVCSLANLYCAYDNGVLIIRNVQVFTVALPPIGGSSDDVESGNDEAFTQIADALGAITKTEVTTDSATSTLIYTASQRTARMAEQYFTRLRANTALIVYETYIWEVTLDNANATGIRWQKLAKVGGFNFGFDLDGGLSNVITGNPISIGLPTRGDVNFGTGDIFRFLSEQGAVKTISQPQITVLSGSSASLKVAETRNYVSELTRTVDDNGDESISTSTGQVDSGFELSIRSAWDDSTVYGKINIQLEEFLGFEDFPAGSSGTLSLPRTSTRELATNIRVRPGDSVLIAGLVREQDAYNRSGPGFNQPILPISRDTRTNNSELVLLLRPRVVAYKPIDKDAIEAAKKLPEDLSKFIYDPAAQPDSDLSVDLIDPSQGPAVVAQPLVDATPKQPDTVPMPLKEPGDWRK